MMRYQGTPLVVQFCVTVLSPTKLDESESGKVKRESGLGMFLQTVSE